MSKINEIMKDYAETVSIAEEEYLTAQKTLPEDEFKRLFFLGEDDTGETGYLKRIIPTLEEISYIIAYKTGKNVRSLKNCVVFFVVLTVISLLISIASMVSASGAL